MTDDATIDELWDLAYLELRRLGASAKRAARELGADHRDVQRRMDMIPAFRDAVEDAIDEAVERVEENVIHHAQEGDGTLGMRVLRALKPEKWMEPDREQVLRVQLPQVEDVAALHQRLRRAAGLEDAGDIVDAEVVKDDPLVLEAGNEQPPQDQED